jgi:hypothetical protein
MWLSETNGNRADLDRGFQPRRADKSIHLDSAKHIQRRTDVIHRNILFDFFRISLSICLKI